MFTVKIDGLQLLSVDSCTPSNGIMSRIPKSQSLSRTCQHSTDGCQRCSSGLCDCLAFLHKSDLFLHTTLQFERLALRTWLVTCTGELLGKWRRWVVSSITLSCVPSSISNPQHNVNYCVSSFTFLVMLTCSGRALFSPSYF